MVKQFIKERQSWIYIFSFLQVMLFVVGYLDPTINMSSMLYTSFLSILIFAVFFIFRYLKESAFYQSLDDWYPSDELGSIKAARSPFEKIIEDKIELQADFFKDELDHHLKQLEEEKDDLLSWIHEVKTPLTTLQLMIERVEDDRLREQLMYEWLRIHLLLDQQLHQRRMNRMENDLYVEEVSLQSIINDEIKGLRTWCMQKGIGFDVNLEVEVVLTDVKWLRFILRQLLTNAVKYSEMSDITVESFIDAGKVNLAIRDEGRGIPEKDISRIFDKGFTSTLNHQDHGATGMGLYLVKKAAEGLKIQIDVRSKVGEGTTFTLIFAKENDFVKLGSM